MYIYENKDWPNFIWDQKAIFKIVAEVKLLQGTLLGKMQLIGFDLKEKEILNTISLDIFKTCEIEGELLAVKQIRSSVARRLGLKIQNTSYVEKNVEGVVEMMLDASQNFKTPISTKRILQWHKLLFQGYSGVSKIKIGELRDDTNGPMQVVSGPYGKETIHYQAPKASILFLEIEKFISWALATDDIDLIIKAGISHIWFLSIHPFEDGNGRLARAISEYFLAKSEDTSQRFYSMSEQIKIERNEYYNIIEKTQKNSLDITPWLIWFCECLIRALNKSKKTLSIVFDKVLFWQQHQNLFFNDRQKKVLNKFMDGFEGKLTSSKWAKICKCSQDTASRDILYLLENNVLIKLGAGRSTYYEIKKPK